MAKPPDRMAAIRAKFEAMPLDRQLQFLDDMDDLMAEAEATMVYEVWAGGEKMPGTCTYDQLRTNFDSFADGLLDDGDELTLRIVAVSLAERAHAGATTAGVRDV